MSSILKSTLNTRPIFKNNFKYIRSDVPVSVTEEEKLWLLERDVKVIVDLRTEEERLKKKCPLESDKRFSYFSMPVTGGNTVPASAFEVSKSYIGMVDEKLHQTIDFITENNSGILYFCNAGKDRTGVVSAILLQKAGMDRKYILEDYMKSEANLKDMLEAFVKQNPSVDIEVITPKRQYMEEFLDWYESSAKIE